MSIRGYTDARAFDQRVTFERKSRVDEADGSVTEIWSPLHKSCWARVDGAKATSPEPMIDDGIHTPRDYLIWIRSEVFADLQLTPLDRVRWGTQILDIRDIPDQQRRGRIIAVIARAGLNQG